jgi:hypothetical protein
LTQVRIAEFGTGVTWHADLIDDLPVKGSAALEAALGDALFRRRGMTDAVGPLEEAERAFARVQSSELPTAAARPVRA